MEEEVETRVVKPAGERNAEEIVQVINHTDGYGGETYNMTASCANCGWRGEVKLSIGVQATAYTAVCPRCEYGGYGNILVKDWVGRNV